LSKPPPNPTDTHVGNKLKLLRQTRGLSQTQVGDALGITFQQVQKYERGANRISASKLHKLAEVLQVAPEYFFEGLEQEDNLIGLSAPDYGTVLAGNSEALALMNAFNRISNRNLRRHIISMVKELAGPEEDAGATG
jgi:transcriptional regulator with XRE-family HTH domain